MKKILSVFIMIALLCMATACSVAESSVEQHTSQNNQQMLQETTSSVTATNNEETTRPRSIVDELLESMTLEEKVGQLFMIDPGMLVDNFETFEASPELLEKAEKYHIGGWIFFKPNIQTPVQTKKLISDLSSVSKCRPFIGVDEEGGIVSRIGSNSQMGVKKQPAMAKIGGTGNPENAYQVGLELGAALKELGFNLDFAPVADINTNPDNPVIGSRSFGNEPELVAEMVAAEVKGFDSQGIISCLKHFPGHGDTSSDTHTGAASVTHDIQRLKEVELVPFQKGIDAGADMVMIGHISVPNVTGNNEPAVISYQLVTELLREKMGYNGVAITDSMIMRALYDKYTLAESSVLAINAGVDILLMQTPETSKERGTPSEQFDEAYHAVISAVKRGDITEERLDISVRRILELKVKRGIITNS